LFACEQEIAFQSFSLFQQRDLSIVSFIALFFQAFEFYDRLFS